MAVLHRLPRFAALATGAVALTAALAAPAAAIPAAAPEPPGRHQAATPGDLFAAYDSTVQVLRGLGIDPFLYPTAAAFCADGSALGLVPAVAGAVPGPWPKTNIAVPGLDLTAVKAGQALFTFIPVGLGPESGNTAGMQVAWFNVSNGRGGVAAMGPIAEIFRGMIPPQIPAELRPQAERAIAEFFLAALPVGGIRAVPVDTGRGTVLAAVFGTVDNGGRSCFFLPTVGITTVP